MQHKIGFKHFSDKLLKPFCRDVNQALWLSSLSCDSLIKIKFYSAPKCVLLFL